MYCDLHKRDVYAIWEVLNQNNWCVYGFILNVMTVVKLIKWILIVVMAFGWFDPFYE